MMAFLSDKIDASRVGQLFHRVKRAIAPAPDAAEAIDRTDRLLAIALGLLGLVLIAWTMTRIPAELYRLSGFDIWFQADQPRVIQALSDRASPWHYRDDVHPLFSVLTYPPVLLLRLLGLAPVFAGQVVIALAGFVTVALLLLTLRHLGVNRGTAVLGTLAYLASSTVFYWHGLVETYALVALTAIAAVYLVARSAAPSAAAQIACSAISLAMIVTNWTLGLLLIVAKSSLSRSVQFAIGGLLLCVVLAAGQRIVFPAAEPFYRVAGVLQNERSYSSFATDHKAAVDKPIGTPLARLGHVVLSAAVAPAPYLDQATATVSNQLSRPGEGGWLEWLAIGAWLLALFLSVGRLVTRRRLTPLGAALLVFMIGQAVLYLAYGEVTFLYAGNFFVILVLLACLGHGGRLATLHSAALALFVVAGFAANLRSFERTTELARQAIAMRSTKADAGMDPAAR